MKDSLRHANQPFPKRLVGGVTVGGVTVGGVTMGIETWDID